MEVRGPSDLGFIDAKTGRLRTKDELKSLDNKDSQQSQGSSSAGADDTSARRALRSVGQRTSAQVNSFAGVLNENLGNLKSAQGNIREARQLARGIKQALKDGDKEKATELQAKFAENQSARDAIAKEITSDNERLADNRIQTIRVGNDQRARFQTDEVRFSASSEVDTNSIEGLNKFLDDSGEDLTSIRSQIQDERALRKEVRQVNRDIRSELNKLASESDGQVSSRISEFSEAESTAQSVAIQVGSQATLESAISSDVESETASRLLEGL